MGPGRRAVSAAIVNTMAIDPLLAAEMIYRSTAGVWDEIKEAIVAFVGKWHSRGQDADPVAGRGEPHDRIVRAAL